MNNKLSGWKAQTLNMEGRTTLIHSVQPLFQIAPCKTTYYQHILEITLIVSKEIFCVAQPRKKKKRKIHLASWITITTPKILGGLGLY